MVLIRSDRDGVAMFLPKVEVGAETKESVFLFPLLGSCVDAGRVRGGRSLDLSPFLTPKVEVGAETKESVFLCPLLGLVSLRSWSWLYSQTVVAIFLWIFFVYHSDALGAPSPLLAFISVKSQRTRAIFFGSSHQPFFRLCWLLFCSR